MTRLKDEPLRNKTITIHVTHQCNLESLEPTFYIVKLGVQVYTSLYLFLLLNIYCGYALERVPDKKKKNITIFHLKTDGFTAVKVEIS